MSNKKSYIPTILKYSSQQKNAKKHSALSCRDCISTLTSVGRFNLKNQQMYMTLTSSCVSSLIVRYDLRAL